MGKIVVSAHDVLYNGNIAPAYARVYASQTFENDSDETVIGGGIDSQQYIKQVSVSYSAGVATIASFSGANRLDNNTYGTDPIGVLATYTLTLNAANGKRLAIVYSGLVVPASPTTTTWTDIELYTNARRQPYRQAYYTREQVNTLLDGLDLAPDATDVIIGKSRLSYLQSSLADPIAVGYNDPLWRGIRESVELKTYGDNQSGLDAAITAIGATQTTLKVTGPVTISSNTTLPSNILLSIEGDGAFSINSGRTLTIGSMAPCAPYQIFSGSGSAVFAKNATGGKFHLEWWAGITNSGDCSHAMAQVITSMTTSTGSVCYVGPGIWKHDGVTVPNGCFFEGAGHSTDITSGTVFKPFSTSAIDLFTFASGALYSGLRNCTVSTNGTISTSSRAAVLTTNAITSFGVQFKNVHFNSTLAGTTIFEINDAGSNLEATSISFDECVFTVPANGIAFKSESINTTVQMNSPLFAVAAGGTCFYIAALGWLEITGLDARGPGSFVSTQTTDRTITGSLDGGTGVLTLTSGAFEQNDVGQPFTRGAGTGYIKGLLTSTTANTSYSGSNVANGTLTMERYVPSTSAAGKVFHIVGDHNTFECSGYADEGFQYFLVNDASTNVSPITFNGMTIQSRVVFNAAAVVVFNYCALLSGFIYDVTGITGSVFFNSCSWKNNTTNVITGLTTPELTATRWQGVLEGATKCYTDTSFHEDIQQQFFETRANYYDTGDGATTPIAVFASASETGQPTIRIGKLDPYTWDVIHYYDFYRDDTTDGWLQIQGSQSAPNKGIATNCNIQTAGSTFIGGVVSPAQITASQHNYNPGDSSTLVRLTANGNYDITGIGLTTTQRGGEFHAYVLLDNRVITYKNQSASSSAANRFQTNTNLDIQQSQYEVVFFLYDATTQRWRVWKPNITGLTSNGTTLDVALLLAATSADFSGNVAVNGTTTLENALECNGTAQFDDAVTVNAGVTFNGTAEFNSTAQFDGAVTTTSSVRSTSPTAGLGFGTGAGGSVVQSTSKVTAFTLSKVCGQITFAGDQLDAGEVNSATWTNTAIAATDVVMFNHLSGGTIGAYWVNAQCGAGSATINIKNVTAGNLTEAPVFSFVVIKGVTS